MITVPFPVQLRQLLLLGTLGTFENKREIIQDITVGIGQDVMVMHISIMVYYKYLMSNHGNYLCVIQASELHIPPHQIVGNDSPC